MRRREFIAGITVAAWPTVARAQQRPMTAGAQERARMRQIAILKGTADDSEGRAHIAAFRQELEALGWIEGRNLHTVLGWTAGSIDNMRRSAKEMVEQRPELIVAETTPVVAALIRESRTMPIVFVNVSDPIGSGFVASLPHPGSMTTGFVSTQPPLGSKWAQLLREIAPEASRLGFMFNPDTAPYVDGFVHSAEAAAVAMGAKLIAAPVHNDSEIERALATLGSEPGGGLIVLPEATTNARSALIIELAARHRVPAVYGWQFEARGGGLLSYGLDLAESYRGAATYVNRILKGEKPGDLPVQLPTRYPMIINLRTAKALGLTIPPNLLAVADEVIE
jgi:putative ABC transport system substrate-binding protein